MNENQKIDEILKSAIEHHKKNDFENAEKLYKKILNIDAEHFRSIFLLGSLSAQIRNLTAAKSLLERAIKINPKHAEAHYNLGNVSGQMGDFKQAIKLYKKAIEINPNYFEAYNNLGNLLRESGEILQTIKLYEKAIEINSNYFEAHNNLGVVFAALKEVKKAIASYKKAIEINPNYAVAHNNLGLIFHEIGMYKDAILHYEKAIKINPNYSDTYGSLGKLFKELGKFEKATYYYEKATKFKPENLVFLFYLSELKKKILDIDLKNKIIENIKDDNCTKLNLAYAYFLLSNYELKEKNYPNEFNYLLKAHSYYFESKKEIFENQVDYWLNTLPNKKELINFDNFNVNITKNDCNIKPIFIIGVPRSGSTLIEKVIGSSVQHVPLGEETSILSNVIRGLIANGQSLISDKKILKSLILEKYKNKGLVQKKNDFVFTDKSLENFFFVNLIKEIFPNAKVINCKRNSLSCIMSILKNNLIDLPWAHNIENIFKYFDIYHKMSSKFKNFYSNFIYNLQYESFVRSPELESKKLLNYCNLPWDKKCLEFYKREEIISRTASNMQIRAAINTDATNKYLLYKELLNKYGKKYQWFNEINYE